jgi:hypothetical protein
LIFLHLGAKRQVQLELLPLCRTQDISGRERAEFGEVIIAMIQRELAGDKEVQAHMQERKRAWIEQQRPA